MSVRSLVTALFVLLLGSGVALAEEQEKHFTWHPGLLITMVGDDDPYLENGGDAAFGAWFQPSLELGYRGDFFDLGGEFGADIRRYIGEGDLSEEFYRLSAHAEVGILPGLSLKLSDGYLPRAETIWAPGDETENLIQTNRADVEIRFWREIAERREILATLRGTHFTSEDYDAALLKDDGDVKFAEDFIAEHWEGAATLELQSPLPVWERSAAYLRGQALFRSYVNDEITDHAVFTVLLGIRTRKFRNVDIDVAAGWGMISFDSRDNLQSFVGEGSLRYRLPNGWTWLFSAANRFVADVTGNNFVESTARMGVERYFDELTRLSLSAFISRLDNDAWEMDENVFGGAEVRVRRQIGSHTELSVTYPHWRNDGDFSFDDFNQNRVALEISYRR